ncbi:MAG: stage II sporulation protein R [Firmicutes bacterium]|nr:stage II sporulation protein R [Bacillota bacterium]
MYLRSPWYLQTLAGAVALLAGTGLLVAGGALGRPGPVPAPAPPLPGLESRPLRFQVLANSDAPGDQALKLRVRDAVLPILQAAGQEAADGPGLARELARRLPEIEAAARQALGEAGSRQPVRAELATVPFPTRTYGPLTLPAGEYPTLRLVLGRGEGRNWWCVLFPPLCFPESAVQVEWRPAPRFRALGAGPGARETQDWEAHPVAVVAALRRARSPLILDEREVRELPVQARWALVDWLRSHGWLKR